ncbi:uncharacterized protein LOC143188305 [Calliopsis andreniformis]|uniref:uncharacterized protein LOC143188305 n=1 Tax=Calliopsis andreniformis TaxID=337506 RepID=UPI003FCD152D
MFLLKVLPFYSCLIVLATNGAVKTPTGSTWPYTASKPAYSRALGPPVTGMDTITVPYVPKSPLFPKFVDPKTMISKKTDLLSNLFGGLGPAYPMGVKPFMPYAISDMYGTADEAQPLNSLSKSGMEDSSSPYKRGIFGPFSPKPFAPMYPKFGSMSPYSDLNSISDYSPKSDFSRKRRSTSESSVAKLRAIMGSGKPETKDVGPPPPYPTLAPISEEPEEEVNLLLKAMGSSTVPTEYLPGMFGPFGPMIDPSMFIAKKSAFLDTLFKNLATTTLSPPTTETPTTEAPTTESTIVPSGFWLPSSVIPSPTEYSEKVGEFLDKLFESLKLNKTTVASDSTSSKSDLVRSIKVDEDATQTKIKRSIEDLSSISVAKDTIVDSIMSELGDLKSNMVTTMDDLITYEKSTAAASSKKPFKPFAPGAWSKPTVDGLLPFQQKMAILSQVFDMLTNLQKNITLAVQNAIQSKMASASTSEETVNTNYPMMANDILSTTSNMPVNMSLLDAIKNKLGTLNYEMPASYALNPYKFGPKATRMLPQTPASFWMSYPGDSSFVAQKRQVNSNTESLVNEKNDINQKQQIRSVKMQMHQGYQSLPSGSVETVEAGGGSTPGHQGGGIKLLDTNDYEDMNKWANWMEYMRNDYQGRRHHNHH